MNQLHVGKPNISLRGRRRFLFIADEIPSKEEFSGGQIFDLSKHSFNPFQRPITTTDARNLTSLIYSLYPQGENTLTARNGRMILPDALLRARRLDLVAPPSNATPQQELELKLLINDMTFSPLIRQVLCKRSNFSLTTTSAIFLRLNRAEIGDFDALILGLFFINAFKGQLIIPDFGFYGRNTHISLIRQNRLIAGVRSLDEVPLPLRRELLSIKDVHASHVLYDDAVLLAKHAGLRPDPLREDNPYNDFIARAM